MAQIGNRIEPQARSLKPVSESSAARVVRYALAALFGLAALAKLVGMEATVETFDAFGYTQNFRILIGVLELAGAIALLYAPFAFQAAVGLGLIMVGAIFSHLIHDPPYMAIPAVIVLAGLGFVASCQSRVREALPAPTPIDVPPPDSTESISGAREIRSGADERRVQPARAPRG